MGLTCDKDVRTVRTKVHRQILAKYNADRWDEIDPNDMPQAKPMLIDWVGGRDSTWNRAIFEAFTTILNANISDLGKVPLPETEVIERIFFSRLLNLRRLVNELKPRELPDGTTETKAQIKTRIAASDEVKRDNMRDNQRRNKVRDAPSYSQSTTLM